MKPSRHRPAPRRPAPPKAQQLSSAEREDRHRRVREQSLKNLQAKAKRVAYVRELLPSQKRTEHQRMVAQQYATTFDAINHAGKPYDHFHSKGSGANRRWVFSYRDGSRKSFLCPEIEDVGKGIDNCRS